VSPALMTATRNRRHRPARWQQSHWTHSAFISAAQQSSQLCGSSYSECLASARWQCQAMLTGLADHPCIFWCCVACASLSVKAINEHSARNLQAGTCDCQGATSTRGDNVSGVTACRSAGSSPEPRRRAVALTVCAVLTEGCAEQLRKRLNQVRHALLARQQPLAPQQRFAACAVQFNHNAGCFGCNFSKHMHEAASMQTD
jgi:hypothetical protein